MRWVVIENNAYEYNRGITVSEYAIDYGTHNVSTPFNITLKEVIALVGGGWVYDESTTYFVYPLSPDEIRAMLTQSVKKRPKGEWIFLEGETK